MQSSSASQHHPIAPKHNTISVPSQPPTPQPQPPLPFPLPPTNTSAPLPPFSCRRRTPRWRAHKKRSGCKQCICCSSLLYSSSESRQNVWASERRATSGVLLVYRRHHLRRLMCAIARRASPNRVISVQGSSSSLELRRTPHYLNSPAPFQARPRRPSLFPFFTQRFSQPNTSTSPHPPPLPLSSAPSRKQQD